MNITCSRWAALGAAVAVVAGAGDIGFAQAAPVWNGNHTSWSTTGARTGLDYFPNGRLS